MQGAGSLGVAAALLALFPAGIAGQAQHPLPPDSIEASAEHRDSLPGIDTVALRAHTRFLADDYLEGRGTGTPGEQIAALYVASQLLQLGIPGGGEDGSYFQPVPLERARIDTAGTTLRIQKGAGESEFSTPGEFLVGTGGAEAFHGFAGEAIFVGDAATALTTHDGAENLDGVTVVVSGTLGDAALHLVPRWVDAGVAGVISLVTDPDRFDLLSRSRGDSRYYATVDVQDPIWQPNLPMLLAGPRMARVLLEEILGDGSHPPQPADLPVRLDRHVEAVISVDRESVETANVVGILPGSDPEVREQVVVYTAHHDHLGISSPDATGDSIYNGFSDNAAGVAMVLAIAGAMQADPPARTVLFLFLTGEERGLLGSSYFVEEPILPLKRIVAVINLDAGAPPAPPRTWRIAGGSDSPLGPIAAEVAVEHGWEATLSPASPNSDYWPFLVRGVPSIFLIPGGEWEGVDSQRQAALRERWDHYHQPSDHWASDFPFSGVRRYAQFALAVGRMVADAETTAFR